MVIKCGSLTAAAEELGYTLSEISRSMKTLEESVTGGRKISGIYHKRTIRYGDNKNRSVIWKYDILITRPAKKDGGGLHGCCNDGSD